MLRHIVIDRRTGELKVMARDGRTYSPQEVEAAERRARAGDAEAAALVESLELPPTFDAHDLIDNCPECRAARARGEEPQILEPRRPRRKPPLRWRKRKQRRAS